MRRNTAEDEEVLTILIFLKRKRIAYMCIIWIWMDMVASLGFGSLIF